jgi:hypothetical protein
MQRSCVAKPYPVTPCQCVSTQFFTFSSSHRYIDGEVSLVQSNTILRYVRISGCDLACDAVVTCWRNVHRFIAEKYELYGATTTEKYTVDMLLEGIESLRSKYLGLIYTDSLVQLPLMSIKYHPITYNALGLTSCPSLNPLCKRQSPQCVACTPPQAAHPPHPVQPPLICPRPSLPLFVTRAAHFLLGLHTKLASAQGASAVTAYNSTSDVHASQWHQPNHTLMMWQADEAMAD